MPHAAAAGCPPLQDPVPGLQFPGRHHPVAALTIRGVNSPQAVDGHLKAVAGNRSRMSN